MSNISLHQDVRQLVSEMIQQCLKGISDTINADWITDFLAPGKMVRTSFAERLQESDCLTVSSDDIAQCCAAVELMHTASLCHDDVIDQGVMRRGKESLWRRTGNSAAILIGDLVLCNAIELISNLNNGKYISSFIGTVTQMCRSELKHEIQLNHTIVDDDVCLQIARDKTGAPFAFIGEVCGGNDARLSRCLKETGYDIGIIYQLVDDLHDVVGDENVSRKTLGTDKHRGKYTLAQAAGNSSAIVRRHIFRISQRIKDNLSGYPEVQSAVIRYFHEDLHPLFSEYAGNIELAF